MIPSLFGRLVLLAVTLATSTLAHAQYAAQHDSGWEGGLDVLYQDATTVNFNGGTTANLDTDWGLAFTLGYRFNAHLAARFGLDWNNVDYRVNLVLGTGGIQKASGTYESFTPRFSLEYSLLERPLTPYVTGGIGYSFVDTNIANGRPQTGCWWDPWYGYVCTTVQSTKTADGFAYQAGLGVRWDVSDTSSLRLSFERHWVDFGHSGTPSIDQIRLGYSWRYY